MNRFMHVLVAGAAAATFACGGDNANRNGSAENMSSDRGDMATNERNEGTRTMLTGCLLAGGDAGSYVLQLASASAAPGTTVSSPADSAAETYRIVAGNNDDLAKHLDKRVAVEGYVSRAANAPVGTSGAQGSSGSAASDSRATGSTGREASIPAASLPSVRVESIREVAGECHETPVPRSNNR